jgi:hypothetical protein
MGQKSKIQTSQKGKQAGSQGARQAPQGSSEPSPSRLRRAIARLQKTVWAGVAAVATVLAFAVFWPDVSIDESRSPLDPDNIFTQPFIVTNNSWIALHEMAVECFGNGVYYAKPTGELSIVLTKIPFGVQLGRTYLAPGDSTTIYCRFDRQVSVTGRGVIKADITIRVKTTPVARWWPRPYLKEKRLETTTTVNGLVWLPKALTTDAPPP